MFFKMLQWWTCDSLQLSSNIPYKKTENIRKHARFVPVATILLPPKKALFLRLLASQDNFLKFDEGMSWKWWVLDLVRLTGRLNLSTIRVLLLYTRFPDRFTKLGLVSQPCNLCQTWLDMFSLQTSPDHGSKYILFFVLDHGQPVPFDIWCSTYLW